LDQCFWLYQATAPNTTESPHYSLSVPARQFFRRQRHDRGDGLGISLWERRRLSNGRSKLRQSETPITACRFMSNPLVSVIVPAHNAAPLRCRKLCAPFWRRPSPESKSLLYTTARRTIRRRPWMTLQRTILGCVWNDSRRAAWPLHHRAIECATGEFIAPMDADDLWHPTKLESQLERFQGSESDLGLVYSGFR
jgi:hypothetical protein